MWHWDTKHSIHGGGPLPSNIQGPRDGSPCAMQMVPTSMFVIRPRLSIQHQVRRSRAPSGSRHGPCSLFHPSTSLARIADSCPVAPPSLVTLPGRGWAARVARRRTHRGHPIPCARASQICATTTGHPSKPVGSPEPSRETSSGPRKAARVVEKGQSTARRRPRREGRLGIKRPLPDLAHRCCIDTPVIR